MADAEHVGVLRSTAGNLPHILSRFAAHRKSLFAIMPIGTAKAHRGNPAANLRAHSTHCLPVFFSGVGSLVLNSSEVTLLDQYMKVTVQQLQKLCDKTPHCAVLFLGGQLPGKALFHLRLFSILGMITRLPGSIIHKIALYQFAMAKPSSGSWFLQLRDLSIKYSLPSPISLLEHPMTKYSYKKLVKSRVIDFWEGHLREESYKLREDSLKYFRAEYMSLMKPHPLWSSCGSNPYEIHKAQVQAKMLSGRYVTDKLARHWRENSSGICSIPGCTGQDIGSLEHMLLFCPALSQARDRAIQLCHRVSSESDDLRIILFNFLNGQTTDIVMQFLLDCSAFPEVIKLRQNGSIQILEKLFYITRTWCYSIHRSRMTKLGLFQYR